ncbi:tenascin isoform X3 [Echeneis naucrates]|uniref:tenascin isoform X3 n=1 Tax=Echeneis naucrates TaxID=173247 RepID=UPI0011143E21|nr:tenascin-like isoform X3 [Echeneis naucrates]
MIPLLLILLLARLALLTPSTSQELEVRGHRTQRDTKQDSIKVVISEGCVGHDGSSDSSQGGKEIELAPGSPLVLTHKIKLVPSGLGPGSGSCDCEADLAALRERVERLEREVSALREKCGGAEGGCCSSKESKGAGCSIKPNIDECPNECSDQGRCVDGKCVCFPGFSGPDCSDSNCPGNCNNRGRCVNGQCVCDPGFSGPDCSEKPCPGNCNNRGRCVNGQCVCNPGFTGPDCSKKACPDNCNNRGRCVNGKCVCDSGYTGANCAEIACPGNCNNRGRCVNGQCFCNPGFTGPDCSKKACPDNCNNRGRCVNGQCFCNPGFTGPDCSKKACPDNCNNRGRCVNGQCVCDDGFGGPDCSEKVCPNDCSDLGRCIDGRCVCDSGFTGDDCSEEACPGNCNNRGRCVNGQCVCNPGFTGPDCSKKACPDNCNNRGRCVNGKCVCDSGYTGANCAEIACPGNCNNRGRCVNGQCVCDDGFTGADCSEKSCPNNCSNKGKCVNGKCVCNAGFAAPDCAAKSCPNNCSNKGRCIKGRCLCRRGFTGPDCSQCEDGMTGPNCDTAMSGVSQLRTQDITETSVTLVWTPPPVQYESYLITFRSQKESDQQITSQVQGSLTTFTQTGLAAGQEYSVTITGEVDGRKGAESSSEFMTLISSPTNLKVVKTTSTSAVVQWEKSQGEIDRYRLTITPSDGSGTSEELSVPANQDSAHIKRLEAGRLYDIVLVAEKGNSQSQPANTQAVPGPEPPTNIIFSEVTESSMTVSWSKPKRLVDGFKVTYTHTEEGEPVSVLLDSGKSNLSLTQLSPGSTYEVSVISVLGLDESDLIKDTAMTLPDAPTDLRALNVTDTKALLLWRPALAAVDKYAIVYGSETGSPIRIVVSGNAAEKQLSGLEGSTTYTVTISSLLGDRESPPATGSFTTARDSGSDGPQDLLARDVTPRTALLSWKLPSKPADRYRLTYQTEGQEVKEVMVDTSVTAYNLSRLHPGSKYTVQLQAEGQGQHSSVSTEFTTA